MKVILEMRAALAATLILFAPALAAAQEPAPSPTATPFPSQDPPPPDGGVPTGFDDAIRVPGATPTPTPQDHLQFTGDDDFLKPEDKSEEWDPRKVFPGNYYALPLTVDVGWRPCLDCAGDVYVRPGEVSLWAGYAFQPFPRTTSPFMAGGLEWIVAEVKDDGRTYGRSRLTPTWRFGWNFSAASVYGTAGVILPSEGRDRVGYHAGLGVSSFAMMALAACAAEAIPSVLEVGWDVLPDPETNRMEETFVLKLGWGF